MPPCQGTFFIATGHPISNRWWHAGQIRITAPVPAGQRVRLEPGRSTTLADVVGCKLPADAAEDSHSLLPYFRGQAAAKPLHEAVICHSASGYFVVRRGKWKLLFCRGSGGWSPPREREAAKLGLPSTQLYDLTADPK